MAAVAPVADGKDQHFRRACSLPLPVLPKARCRSRSVCETLCNDSYPSLQRSDQVLFGNARQNTDAIVVEEEIQEVVSPSQPRRRELRERHAAQLNPYTTEMMRYRASLVRNDWQDAVVISAEIARAARLKRREEVDDSQNEPGSALRVRHSADEGGPRKERTAVDKEIDTLVDFIATSSYDHRPVVRTRKRQRAVSDSEESDFASKESTPDLQCTSSGSASERAHLSVAVTAESSRPAEERRDYRRLLRTLRRTMPLKMARLYIEDLKAMDAEGVEEESGDQASIGSKDNPAKNHEALRPGETRLRQTSKSMSETNWDLLGSQSESESEDSSTSTPHISSPTMLPSTTMLTSQYGDAEPRYAASERRRTGFERSRFDDRRSNGDDLDAILSRGNASRSTRDRRALPSSKKTKSTRESVHGMSMELTRQRGGARKRGDNASKVGTRAVESYRAQTTSISYLRPPRPADTDRFRSRYCVTDEKELFEDPGICFDGSTSALHNTAAGALGSRYKGSQHIDYASKLDIPGSPKSGPSRSHCRPSSPMQVPLKEIFAPQPAQSAIKTEICEKDITNEAALEAWRYAGPFPLTFGIEKPPIGLRCHPQSFIGRGKLYSLLHPLQATSSLAQVHCDLEQAELFDDVLAALRSSDEPQLRLRLTAMTEAILGRIENSLPDQYEHDRILRGLWNFVEDCLARAKIHLETGEHSEVKLLVTSSLQWLQIVLSWRTLQASTDRPIADTRDGVDLIEIREEAVNLLRHACGDLMLTLLSHGLHRTMSTFKTAVQHLNREGTVQDVQDDSLYFWVSVIHLLSDRVAVESLSSPSSLDSPPFWPILMDALARYQSNLLKRKGPYIASENTWYTLNAIHALGHFTATTGSASSESPIARPYWPLVRRALILQKLRFGEREELAASSQAIRQRDAYIRTVLRRVLRLMNGSTWQTADLESILAYFYTLLDSHRLQDLPSEDPHDFSAFLRLSDPGLLQMESSRDDKAFDTFTLILAKSVKRIRETTSGCEKDRDRAVERILSRFSPMRTLPFTTDTAPTSLQRSSLYNHYNIALLYLFLVPSSSERRLLQLQQYLRLGKADYKSKVICIRAMMYAGLLVHDHKGALESVMRWFSSTFSALLRQLKTFDDFPSKTSSIFTSSKADRELAEQKTVVAACLRVVQYVIQGDEKVEVGAERDLRARVLPVEWFRMSLDPPFVTRYPTVALETLRLLQCYLRRYGKRQSRLDKQRATLLSDSQDSYSDLFDSVDLDDAALLQASGYSGERGGQSTEECEDDAIVTLLHEGISPILFSLINHIAQEQHARKFALALQDSRVSGEPAWTERPDGRRSVDNGISLLLDETSCSSLGTLLVQLWARCGQLLVRSCVRTWDYYLRGAEDLRLLSFDIARHNVTVAFFIEILGDSLDNEVNADSERSRHPYLGNFWDIWTSILTFLALPKLPTGFAEFLLLVAQHESKQTHRGSILSDDRAGNIHLVTGALRKEIDWQARSALIAPILANLPSMGLPKDVIKSLSAMLTGLRLTSRRLTQKPASRSLGDGLALQTPAGDHDENTQWRAFALHIIASSQRSLPGDVLRGLSEDLRRTHDEVSHLEY